MANRTVKDAHSIHGTNPQYLVEKIIRTRIYESKYWKEECFGLTGMLPVGSDKLFLLKSTSFHFKPTPLGTWAVVACLRGMRCLQQYTLA
uniref:Pre-mRNA-splicing factor 38B n=1 Tax=Falco tinnunculus TaxID=100819 RepID=A0A8C4UPS8_FALTI